MSITLTLYHFNATTDPDSSNQYLSAAIYDENTQQGLYISHPQPEEKSFRKEIHSQEDRERYIKYDQKRFLIPPQEYCVPPSNYTVTFTQQEESKEETIHSQRIDQLFKTFNLKSIIQKTAHDLSTLQATIAFFKNMHQLQHHLNQKGQILTINQEGLSIIHTQREREWKTHLDRLNLKSQNLSKRRYAKTATCASQLLHSLVKRYKTFHKKICGIFLNQSSSASSQVEQELDTFKKSVSSDIDKAHKTLGQHRNWWGMIGKIVLFWLFAPLSWPVILIIKLCTGKWHTPSHKTDSTIIINQINTFTQQRFSKEMYRRLQTKNKTPQPTPEEQKNVLIQNVNHYKTILNQNTLEELKDTLNTLHKRNQQLSSVSNQVFTQLDFARDNPNETIPKKLQTKEKTLQAQVKKLSRRGHNIETARRTAEEEIQSGLNQIKQFTIISTGPT